VVNIVPGLVGLILTMTMVMFTSAAIVRERERGNLEMLINTPISSFELMVAKILPFIVIGLIQTTIILSIGYFVFNVSVMGSISQLFMMTLLFIAASLVLGLIISTVAQTQLQAMQLTIFVLLPSILLSGFMFPYEGMPIEAQYIAEALPATHFIRSIRAIVLREVDVMDMAYDAIWLATFTLVGLLIASLRFKKRLD
jgi:ABC-2 type transport system permease protein